MLPAPNRLQKSRDIEKVFKKGRSTSLGGLILRASLNSEQKVSRFTVVTSLRVSKKANQRNLLKRRIREILRIEILPRIKSSFDCVIITSKPLLDLDYDALKDLVIKICQKARLI